MSKAGVLLKDGRCNLLHHVVLRHHRLGVARDPFHLNGFA